MKKTLFAAAALISSAAVYSQVGINTQTPRATLDVIAKNTNGTTPEGLIPPRLTGNQVQAADAQYGANQRGAIVYVTAPVTSASTKTANITAEGYYYFNGSLWQNLSASSAPPMILADYANSGEGITLSSSNWGSYNYTGTSITLPPNSRYVVTVRNLIASGSNTAMPSGQSIELTGAFSDSATVFTDSPDTIRGSQIKGERTPLVFFGKVDGSIILNNTSANPKTYYYFAGQAIVQGYTGTISRFGGRYWALDTMYAVRVN